jgi:protein TonB
VKDCTVVKSSGSADLDEVTCGNFTTKARFRPATDANGKPVESTSSTQVKWEIK